MKTFRAINKGYNEVFKPGKLSIGIVVPIENYSKAPIPTMERHLERVRLVEKLGFKALWIRDVPLHVPSFGDAGQTFDPFTYLGYLAGQTTTIALGIGSVALPLHHPIHVAKSAATIDQLSGGRLIMGIASGDRFEEYPAMGFQYEKRGAIFREAFTYIDAAKGHFPQLESTYFGQLIGGADILPKPVGPKIPMLVTGHSRQSIEWIAEHSDGWIYYPRNSFMQEYNISQFRDLIPEDQPYDKPFMQPLYVDLQEQDDFKPLPIHLGFRVGPHYLIDYLQQIRELGVNHVAINLRLNQRDTEATLEELALKVLSKFS